LSGVVGATLDLDIESVYQTQRRSFEGREKGATARTTEAQQRRELSEMRKGGERLGRGREKNDAQSRFAAADARPTTASYRVMQLHDLQEAGHKN